jgi:nitrite reductase/ring-hydroxylating ferredoxin subunit
MTLIKLGNKIELENNGRKAVEVMVDMKKKEIAIFNVEGKYYAIDRYCTHAGGDLLNARLEGIVVVCPVHEATFNLETGQLAPNEYLSPHLAKVIKPTIVYPVVVKGEELYLELD